MGRDGRTNKILTVEFPTLSAEELWEDIKDRLDTGRACKVFTPNTQMLLGALRDHRLVALLNSADVKLPDGIGVCLAARRLGMKGGQRLSGIDCAERILSYAAERGYGVFLLGGRGGRARKAERYLCEKYAGLRVVGCHNGYFQKTGSENDRVVRLINAARPQILFVCLGFPAQERWIADNIAALPSVRLAMGLGGSIDVWSGKRHRAPPALRRAGLEWLWRSLRDPRRLSILADIPRFMLYTELQKRAYRN